MFSIINYHSNSVNSNYYLLLLNLKNTMSSKQYSRIFFEGVACLGKTTLLRKIQAMSGFEDEVLFTDYFEFCEKTGDVLNTVHTKEKFSIFNTWYNKLLNDSSAKFIDRSPLSGSFYRWINGDYSDEYIKRALHLYEATGIFEGYLYVVFLPMEGTETYLLENMKRRNNGIDMYTLDYIKNQIHVFKLIIETFPKYVKMIVIDPSKNFDVQQNDIIKQLTD